MTVPQTEQEPIVALWSFWRKHRPEVKEYHITADNTGAVAFRDLIDAILKNRSARTYQFALTANPMLAKRAGNSHKAHMAVSLQIKYTPDAPDDFFNLTDIDDSHKSILMEFGPAYGAKLIEAMNDILNEYGGYYIGENPILHVWWF